VVNNLLYEPIEEEIENPVINNDAVINENTVTNSIKNIDQEEKKN
jgi:hypothetical protein